MRDSKIFIPVILILMVGLIYYMAKDVEPAPCSAQGYPGRCYHSDESQCEAIWTRAKEPCDEFIQGLTLTPGRLTGQILFKCQLTALDKALKFSRKSNSECDEMSKDLETWKKNNDIK